MRSLKATRIGTRRRSSSSARSTALFNFGGRRGEDRDAAIILARRFREMAGFSTDEIDEIAAMAAEQRAALAY